MKVYLSIFKGTDAPPDHRQVGGNGVLPSAATKRWRADAELGEITGVSTAHKQSALETITNLIVERFNARRIVLFGSHARGDAREESDYDLMVELQAVDDELETSWQIKQALPEDIRDVDIHVRTPGEFEKLRDDPGTLDWAISREGVVIYPVGADTSEIRPKGRVREGGEPPMSVKQWLEAANDDVRMVEQLSAQGRVVWTGVCFHAQQAAEKYLKAVLVHHRVYPPRIHDLAELLWRVRRTGARLEDLDADCALLSKYPVEPRYPARRRPNAAQGRAAVAAMRRVVAAVRAHAL